MNLAQLKPAPRPPVSVTDAHRYVFICGLHRSGTTLIARSLAEHPMVSGFKNTGEIEDEGQFLQSVIPREIAFGGVGRFGFDPRAHMTETSALNTPENAARLKFEWGRHWNLDRPVLLEKTPSNLLRMRLLARLFQPSSFVVVVRHPVAAALATMKWTEGNLFSLIAHWVHCYRLARADAALVERALWVSYEAFVADPAEQLARIGAFAGLPPHAGQSLQMRNDNEKYFTQWRTRYFPDADRSIAQIAPERRRNLIERLGDYLEREAREFSRPSHRRKENLRDFYDALDAVAVFEPAIAEFGYSFTDLGKWPSSIGSN